ncbi:hypothetical protein PGT21_020400 [Puccinia graminis f. sp. tritici]|nr:hypothetical protein PGT21_020400 [Puccinia graminis f. sp. tritici]
MSCNITVTTSHRLVILHSERPQLAPPSGSLVFAALNQESSMSSDSVATTPPESDNHFASHHGCRATPSLTPRPDPADHAQKFGCSLAGCSGPRCRLCFTLTCR